ncbi:MAG: hypothetical protein ACFFDW_04340 [Candidatus Thorarchaeota archaeon]
MIGLYTVDLLQILRLKKGLLQEAGNYKLGIITSALIDLINLDRIEFKLRNEKDLYVIVKDNDITGNELLDEIYLTIKDCPKEYTVREWITRFTESYNAFERNHLISLERREILIKEPKSKQFWRYILFITMIICAPFIGLAVIYYKYSMKLTRYVFKNPFLQNQLLTDLYKNLRSLELPEQSMFGLIIILKITGLNSLLLSHEYHDDVVKKYYQLQDYDFQNPNIKELIDYLNL